MSNITNVRWMIYEPGKKSRVAIPVEDKDTLISKLTNGEIVPPGTPLKSMVCLAYDIEGNNVYITIADETSDRKDKHYWYSANSCIFIESVRDDTDYVPEYHDMVLTMEAVGKSITPELFVVQKRIDRTNTSDVYCCKESGVRFLDPLIKKLNIHKVTSKRILAVLVMTTIRYSVCGMTEENEPAIKKRLMEGILSDYEFDVLELAALNAESELLNTLYMYEPGLKRSDISKFYSDYVWPFLRENEVVPGVRLAN